MVKKFQRKNEEKKLSSCLPTYFGLIACLLTHEEELSVFEEE
jgi:hypothetical protein